MRLRTSPAAEFQSIQTRAKMGAALWTQTLGSIVLVWIAVTLWLVWHRTGTYQPSLHHTYFWRWILCDTLADTPFLNQLAPSLPMYAGGAWYNLPEFATWLDKLYGASFYAWCWRATTGIGAYGFGSDFLPVAAGVALLAWWWRRNPEAGHHIRGLSLMTAGEFDGAIAGTTNTMRLLRKPPANSIELGQHHIPVDRLFEHLMVAGNPGTGKSTVIRQVLRQVQNLDRPVIVIDIEGESTMEFYDENRGDFILNPLDERCPFWSPWLELRPGSEPMDAAALAASIVRGRVVDATQKYFQDNARALVRAMFEVIQDRDDLRSFATFLAQRREDIRSQLEGTSAAAIIDPGAHDSGGGQGIISVANTAIEGFAHLPRRDQAQRTWSAREWARNRKGWLFLPGTEDARAAIESLQGVWLDSLVRWLLTRDIGSEDPVFIFCDELAAMGYQPNVASVLARGRKREIACTIGFQSVSQLRSIYGHDGATSLTSCPTTQIFLRTPEPETAKWASDFIGSHEVDRIGISQLTGLSNYREGLTLSPHRAVEPLVIPGELQALEPFEGYICCGAARTSITIPKMHLVRRNPDFIPRVNAPTEPTPKPEDPSDEQILAQVALRAARSAQQADG